VTSLHPRIGSRLWAGFNGAHFACKSVANVSGVSRRRHTGPGASLVSSRLVLSRKLSLSGLAALLSEIRGRTSLFQQIVCRVSSSISPSDSQIQRDFHSHATLDSCQEDVLSAYLSGDLEQLSEEG
jgi:hypothetical protein